MPSDDEIIQRAMPGSTTFHPKVMCPKCGWHFAKGFTDPTGQHTSLEAGAVTICGSCLSPLRFAGDPVAATLLTPEDFAALPREEQDELKKFWFLAYLARMTGPHDNDRKGPIQ